MKGKYINDVVTLKLDDLLCTTCGECIKVCPREVFNIINRKLVISNIDFCIECGACALNCPEEALSVNSGVGCAEAIINGLIYGTEPVCGCSDDIDESKVGQKKNSGCC